MRRPKSHCLSGHPMVAENVYLDSGRPVCRQCLSLRKRRYYRRIVWPASHGILVRPLERIETVSEMVE